jgi:hypothetical protein
MIKAVNLKAKYLIDPIGIDITIPRLFWSVDVSKSKPLIASPRRLAAKSSGRAARSYLIGCAPFWHKWLNDLADRQAKDGKVHCIVPTVGNEGYLQVKDGCVGWEDASTFVPVL